MRETVNFFNQLWAYRPTKVIAAGAGGYVAPYLIASLMRSSSANPVAIAFALGAMTLVGYQQYRRPADTPKTDAGTNTAPAPGTVPVAEGVRRQAAMGASEAKEVPVAAVAAAEQRRRQQALMVFKRTHALALMQKVLLKMKQERAAVASPVASVSSNDDFDSADEAKSGALPGSSRDKSPFLAAARDMGVFTPSQADDLQSSWDGGGISPRTAEETLSPTPSL